MEAQKPFDQTPADWTPGATIVTDFDAAIDHVLQVTTHIARDLIGAHQAAAAMIVGGDWKTTRKYFSLSSKYSQWFDYHTPAVGFGIHALIVTENKPIRLTQALLQAHPEWKGFGVQAGEHPPLRGWLAVPVIGWDNRNYGLLQVSDKYDDAEFTADDELHFVRLAQLTAAALEGICALVNNNPLGRPPQAR
jgi:GAF domain-containing protein